MANNRNLKNTMQERAQGETVTPEGQRQPEERQPERQKPRDGVGYRIDGDFTRAEDVLQKPREDYPGREGKIGQKEIDHAWQTLLQYKTDREPFTRRIRQNQEYFELCNTSGRLRNPDRAGEYQKSQSIHM